MKVEWFNEDSIKEEIKWSSKELQRYIECLKEWIKSQQRLTQKAIKKIKELSTK